MEELSAAEEDSADVCREKKDQMCPEGTFATTARRWNQVAGAAAAGSTFLVAKLTLLPLGATIGGIAGGPPGATAGFFIANALVAPLAITAGYLASRGPEECACFPRECSFDATQGMCRLDSSEESPSKNIFSNQLPMSGMKCALKYKKDNECSLQQCTAEDYAREALGQAEVFGIVGQHAANLYNCLSTSGSQSDTLAAVAVLPGGVNNTIAARNKIFKQAWPAWPEIQGA
uniref:Uncharacterized protein n=1 Tax=Alexandrium andersonii TaxID=327968 RepID=A0A7S2DL31_9DINO